MPDFGRWNNGGDPSLNEINRTDRFLDALASQQPVYSTDPSEAEEEGGEKAQHVDDGISVRLATSNARPENEEI